MDPKSRILVVDDEPAFQRLMEMTLAEAGYAVEVAANGKEGLDAAGAFLPDLILLDVQMPEMNGFEMMEVLREKEAGIPVIMLTGRGSIPDAIRAIRMGAVDYIEKPAPLSRLMLTVERTLRYARLSAENERLRLALGSLLPPGGLVGQSPKIREVLHVVHRIAETASNVLITGESGTGKEIVARAIHRVSPRRDKPFVAVNCSALPETLLESELFGHERGAFTGADRRRKGRAEAAEGGTLFLDEVGDLTLPVQVKLLRFLEEKTFERVGSNETLRADVRILTATNRDLLDLLREGKFREDLYYRLNVFSIDLPPLRERKEDIPLLAAHFLQKSAEANGREGLYLSPEGIEALQRRDWPGNVRELEHAIERAVILSRSPEIGPESFPDRERRPPADEESEALLPPEGSLGDMLREIETRTIERALRESGMAPAKAAARLQISERSLHYKMQKLGIETPGRRRRRSHSTTR